MLLLRNFCGGGKPFPQTISRYFNDKNVTEYQANVIVSKPNNRTVVIGDKIVQYVGPTITYLRNSEQRENLHVCYFRILQK